MNKRWTLIGIGALGAVLLYRERWRLHLGGIRANVRAFDLPTAGMYDAMVASLLGGFYARVASDVAAAWPSGDVLEVGSGTGRLGVRLARAALDLKLTGLDISPPMVERSTRRVAEEGLAGRARFEIGDVGALPFPDGSFDGVVSTLSLHHWPDPTRGLSEIHRVLKAGGEARIYDLAHWLWPPAHGESRLDRLAAASPFGDRAVEVIRWPWSVPGFVLLRLRRGEDDGS